MLTRDIGKISIRALRQNKTRSVLTMLGIVIGIASVILLMSIGQSAQSLILNQVQSIGSNLIFVIPGSTGSSRFASPASVQGIIIKTLGKNDLDAIRREPSVARATAEVRGQAKIVFENNDATVSYDGTTADLFLIRNFTTTKGAVFTNDDIDSFNHVAVLGSEIAHTLFGDRNPVGKLVRLKDATFTVLGVLKSEGLGPFGVDQDNMVLIPISVAQKQLLGIDYYNAITIQANDAYTIDFTQSRIIAVIRQNHRITDPAKDDFTVRTQADALALLGSITTIMTLFLTSIAAISLVVGGIGIMNIMLVSVVERTREIGLRKAVGATNANIMSQFLVESIMLTFVGGIIGITIGGGLTTVIYFVLSTFLATGWVFSLPISAILLAVGVSSGIGIIFGIYPARQAARKDPIEALRYE